MYDNKNMHKIKELVIWRISRYGKDDHARL